MMCKLVTPSENEREAFLRAAESYQQSGESEYAAKYKGAQGDFGAYLRSIAQEASGEGLRPGLVPSSTFWLLDKDREIAGVVRIRHHLTPALEERGGHIGYDIVPSKRGSGFGNEILRLGLQKAREIGLERVLLTCDSDNERSRKVIEKNGGILAGEVFPPSVPVPTVKFWIDLKEPV